MRGFLYCQMIAKIFQIERHVERISPILSPKHLAVPTVTSHSFSILPFSCGVYAAEFSSLIPFSRANFLKLLDMYSFAPSDIKVEDSPTSAQN